MIQTLHTVWRTQPTKIVFCTIALLVLSFISAATLSLPARAADLSSTSPENNSASYILRYHKSGSATNVYLRLYTEDTNLTASPGARAIEVQKTRNGCRAQSNDNSTVRITNGSDVLLSKKRLRDNNCDAVAYKSYSVTRWEKDVSNGRYFAEITFTLDDRSHAVKWYTPALQSSFEFRIKVNQIKDKPAVGFVNMSGGSGSNAMVGGGTYSVRFATAPCNTAAISTSAGMWDPDPDTYTSYVRLLDKSRVGGSWSRAPYTRDDIGQLITKGDYKDFHKVTGSSGQKAGFDFTMSRDKIYHLTLKTQGQDVVSMFWPGRTIYAFDRCWDVNPSTTLSAPSLSPGNTITWTHTAREVRGLDAAIGLRAEPIHTDSTSSWEAGAGTLTAAVTGQSVAAGKFRTWTEKYTIKTSDVGKTFCSRLQTTPNSSAVAASQLAGRACVTIPGVSDQQLTPSIELDRELANQGGVVLTSPQIDNSASSVVSGKRWRLIRFPGPTSREASASTSDPCAYFGGGSECKEMLKNDNQEIDADGMDAGDFGDANKRSSVIPVDAPIGSQYCFALSVTPYRPGESWYHSKPECATVVKSPKIQVFGGDVRTRQFIKTSTESARFSQSIDASGTLFGSWSQYGALSGEQSVGFATASKFKNGSDRTTVDDPLLHPLTFGNNPIDKRGQYLLPSLPQISFGGSGCSGAANLTPGRYGCEEDVNINRSSSVTGAVVINAPEHTVTIEDNIEYNSDGHSNLANLPQVVIIAKNIVINSNVTQVDAWLVSPEGALKTCNVAEDKELVEADCANRLTINGPVIVDKIELLRTAGSDGSKASNGTSPQERLSSPAEVFNLRPDAYLWASTQGAARSYRTTSVVELPPRF